MGRTFRVFLLAGLCLLSAVTLAICQMDQKVKDDLYGQIELFSYALTTIQSEYVDEKTTAQLLREANSVAKLGTLVDVREYLAA